MGVVAINPHKAVFLDRDGVLNRAYLQNDGKNHPPSSLDELEILSGVAEACELLHEAGFLLIVVTNQPDVARGRQDRLVVEAINNALHRQLPVDDIRVCYHDDVDNCNCRKPKPGMLIDAAHVWQIDLYRSFMVGDRETDVAAGYLAGCQTVLLDSFGSDIGQIIDKNVKPDFRTDTLLTAVHWIVAQSEVQK